MLLRNDFFFKDPYKILFVCLGISLPISIALSNILLVVISFFILSEGLFLKKIKKVSSSKWMVSIIFLVGLHLISLLFFGEFSYSYTRIQKVLLLLTLPIIYTLNIDKYVIRLSIFSFLSSMFLVSIYAISEPGILVKKYGIVHLDSNWTKPANMDYTDYSVFLAVCLIISIYSLFYLKLNNRYRLILVIFIFTYLVSLYSEPGKAGQILFILLLSLLFIYRYRKNLLYLFSSLGFIFLFSTFIYINSDIVKNRFDSTLKRMEIDSNKPLSTRNTLIHHSIELIKDKPIFGYGAGSFQDILTNTSSDINSRHKTPHNDYIYILMELGLVGLMSLLMIFYFQFSEKHQGDFPSLCLPIMFLLLMLVDSYFFGARSSILYIFLSIIVINHQHKFS